jgi:hypothetical protein
VSDRQDLEAWGTRFATAGVWTAFDAGDHGVGRDPDGYSGAAFDGRFVYFAPLHNGRQYHGEVLRYDTQGPFDDHAAWFAFDPGRQGVGDNPEGYSGAVHDGRFVYFVPAANGDGAHAEVLRYDTRGEFTDPVAWATFDPAEHGVGLDVGGYDGGVFDGTYLYFVPCFNHSYDHGEVLRYDTRGAFQDPTSWSAFDAGDRGVGNDADGFMGGAFDGRYLYFSPFHNGDAWHGEVLRYDTGGEFLLSSSWAAFDPSVNGVGRAAKGFAGAVFAGTYVYLVPFANDAGHHGEVLRYDTRRPFDEAASWTAFDPGEHGVGDDPDGFVGAVFDGRHLYFVPDFNGAGFHGEVLRYDTRKPFDEAPSWSTFYPGYNGVGTHPQSHYGAVFDGRFIYFVPNFDGSWQHGEVMRYDTAAVGSRDCNDNLIPDECDILARALRDCDANGVADRCQPPHFREHYCAGLRGDVSGRRRTVHRGGVTN